MKRPILMLVLLIVVSCDSVPPTQLPDATTMIVSTSVPSIVNTPAPATASPAVPTAVTPTFSAPTLTPSRLQNFTDQAQGISFSYPIDWSYLPFGTDVAPGFTLRGPAVGQGPEPIIFAITVESRPATENSAKDVVDQQLSQVPPDLVTTIQRRSLTVAGEPAEEVIGLPSRAGAIETFFLHGGRVYLVVLQPYDTTNESLAQYLDNVRAVYDQVLTSWKFLK